jgi:anti-sigma factor ChrR (cupin superfamily)
MSPLARSILDLFSINLNREAFAGLQWKDFHNGLLMARLAREGNAELILYRVDSDQPLAFLQHEHTGGEVYLVLSGTVEDEFGTYHAGDFVYLERGSIHRPRAAGGTVILVLWPNGVRVVE